MWLITGSTGLIGSYLIQFVLRHKEAPDVVLLVRQKKKLASLLSSLDGVGSRVRVVEGDLFCLDGLCPYLNNIQGVVHLAGLVHAHNVVQFDKVNHLGTRSLYEHVCSGSRRNTVRWIQVSSLAANGPVAMTPDGRNPFVDQDRPVSAYGKSKLDSERYLLRHHPRENLVVLRPPLVFGERGEAFFPLFRLIQAGVLPTWKGSVIPYFSMIDVHHLVRAIWVLMRMEETFRYSIYPTFGEPMHWNQVVSVLRQTLVGSNRRSVPVPVFSSGFGLLSRVMRWTSRWEGTWSWLPVSGDKLLEISSHHWVKDGACQMEQLGVPVPQRGVLAWQRCISAWKQNRGNPEQMASSFV